MRHAISGLEAQLESALYGTGKYGSDWYVPEPQFGADQAQLNYQLERAISYRANIQGHIGGDVGKSSKQNGLAMISHYDELIQKYKLALAGIKPPVSEPPVYDDYIPDITDPPLEDPTGSGEKKSNTLLWIGAGLVGLYLIGKNRRTKKAVRGTRNDEAVALLGVGALLLFSRKKQTEPDVTVHVQNPIDFETQSQSKYIR